MLTPKGKKSRLRIYLTYITLAVLMIVGGIVGLLVWGYNYPAFKLLITWLIMLIVAVIGYFMFLRGIFLNMWSGYSLDENTFTLKDGYPNVKEICVPLRSIDSVKVKKAKGIFKFSLGKMIFYASGKKYVLKNVDYAVLLDLKDKIESGLSKKGACDDEV